MFRTEDKPAPGRLVVVHGFLNTWSDELGIEDFKTPQLAGRWLRQAGLWDERKGPTEKDVERLKAFRAVLRRYVLNKSSKTVIAEMNEFARPVGFTMSIAEDGAPRLDAVGQGVDRAIGNLMEIVFESVANGNWERFKCCELETCGWAFYDHTKNQSGRWCSMKTCGSRHKARQYLKRKAQRQC